MNSQINIDAPFKVGCRYKQRNGKVVMLHAAHRSGPSEPGWAWAKLDGHGDGHRYLLTGADWMPSISTSGCRDLLPGEVDEAGNPVNQSAGDDGWIAHTGDVCPVPEDQRVDARFLSGTVVRGVVAKNCEWREGFGLGTITHYKLAPQEPAAKSSAFRCPGCGVLEGNSHHELCPLLKTDAAAAKPSEPIRPPLTWNKPGPSFADKQFPGYVVTRSGPDDLDAWFSTGEKQ